LERVLKSRGFGKDREYTAYNKVFTREDGSRVLAYVIINLNRRRVANKAIAL